MKVNRRSFLKNTAFVSLSGILLPQSFSSFQENNGELLYNGIQLPRIWPPRNMDPDSYAPMPVPYLSSPPKVIPIDIGRQLFVDDFLIEKTTLKRIFHKPHKYQHNPIFKPETALEQGPFGIPGASPKDGGIWWDPKDKMFKMWYEAGWLYTMAYAVSSDGINWKRPDLNIQPGTNRIIPWLTPDSTTVFIDPYTNNSRERYKMFLRPPNDIPGHKEKTQRGFSMVSEDGMHWGKGIETGICGDRSTIFYNPFRKKWVYSIRSTGQLGKSPHGRSRYYLESSDFLKGAKWDVKDPVYWTGADYLDLPDPEIGEKTQLYNLSANAYESLMLGYFQIWLGPPNEICRETATPKITDLKIAFSRDGFHWDRPDRKAFIPSSRIEGKWDRGYVQSVGGICSVVGDELWFHYIGFKGDKTKVNPIYVKDGMHSYGSTGIAILRRDGFASMVADKHYGTLTTRLVTFKGKYLFVNSNTSYDGNLKVEILNEENHPVSPYTINNCIPVSRDSTIQRVNWKNAEDLSVLSGKKLKFRFHLKRGHLYSFWVSPDESGASLGYNAAGGPGFNGPIDKEGIKAYTEAKRFKI